jgi:signal transduction histidine kinase
VTVSTNCIQALLIEDNPGDARLVRELLRDTGAHHATVQLHHVDRLASGLERLSQHDIDVVLLDLTLPDSSGLHTFESIHSAAPEVPIVVFTGLDDEAVAIGAVQQGAQDYLVKGQVDGGTILRSMRYAVERHQLEATRADLERQRDEFFSSISHDLRTPVAAIKAAIGVVLANEPAGISPAMHRLLGNIDLAADELAAMINDLLVIARLQAGRVELWRSEVDVRDVVNRAVRALEPLVQTRKQRLNVSQPDVPVILSVDAEQLGRVLRNLIGNAQKYGADGGTIVVELKDAADDVCISVSDDGPGISPQDQERIFERFYRGTRSGSSLPGSGLGLAIARGLVELHGGRLSVESAPGQGSTFRIRLPRPSGVRGD